MLILGKDVEQVVLPRYIQHLALDMRLIAHNGLWQIAPSQCPRPLVQSL
jgi:hypothetical protein